MKSDGMPNVIRVTITILLFLIKSEIKPPMIPPFFLKIFND